MTDIEMQTKIERYIREGLPPGEEDQLWIEFLKDPEWYDYFIVELHLRALFRGKKSRSGT